jgi:ribosome recycling factor
MIRGLIRTVQRGVRTSFALRPQLVRVPTFAFAKKDSAKDKRKKEFEKERDETIVPDEIDFSPLEEFAAANAREFEHEVRNVRMGRLTPDIFNGIYLQGLNGIAVGNVAQVLPINATTVSIVPFDVSQKKQIQQAVMKDKFNDFEIIGDEEDKFNVSISPGSTNEKRAKLLKLIGEVADKHKVKLREKRAEFLKSQDKFSKFRSKDVVKNMQKETDAVVETGMKLLEKVTKAKEKELK